MVLVFHGSIAMFSGPGVNNSTFFYQWLWNSIESCVYCIVHWLMIYMVPAVNWDVIIYNVAICWVVIILVMSLVVLFLHHLWYPQFSHATYVCQGFIYSWLSLATVFWEKLRLVIPLVIVWTIFLTLTLIPWSNDVKSFLCSILVTATLPFYILYQACIIWLSPFVQFRQCETILCTTVSNF